MDDNSAPHTTNVDVDSGQLRQRGRSRIAWFEIWNSATDHDVKLDDSLPSRSRQQNTAEECTLNHAEYNEDESLMKRHLMHRIITRCTSGRCKLSGVTCLCQYRILTCEMSSLASVSIAGEHTMAGSEVTSPTTKNPKLTEMKAVIDERLAEDASFTPIDLFAILCKKIERGTLSGPSPLLTQVQTNVKNWRKAHKRDALQPVIDRCCQSMYDLVENIREFGDSLIILCDTKYEDDKCVPNLGIGSIASPFCIGLTCFSMLDTYVSVQRDPRCITIFHIDSTHSVVKQRFPVFIFGISDCRGKFFPIVYFCTSKRTGNDIKWCIAFTKRVVWETFMVSFSPKFVMSDADNAQYNACSTALPNTKFLMCWFHVCQNVKDYTRGKLEHVTIDMIFRDLNNLHYARDEEEYLIRRTKVLASWRSASTLCDAFRNVADHIIAQWLLHPRFSNWQAYHTPPGYASTNNPLEQYHKALKLVNKSKKATPTELVERLDKSRSVRENEGPV